MADLASVLVELRSPSSLVLGASFASPAAKSCSARRKRREIARSDGDDASVTEKAWSFSGRPAKSAPSMTSAALGFEIIGTGHYAPGPPVTNAQLCRVMDTSDEWIFQRSGIRQRHYAPEGIGASDLGVEAAKRAIEAAGISPGEIDYIVFATMTPDYVFPGSAALVGAKLGIDGVPGLDIRQQCGAMLFGVQLVDALVRSGAAKTILFIGAEAHAGFMPWDDWDVLMGESDRAVTPEARA